MTRKDAETQSLMSAMMRAQVENTERLLSSQATSTGQVMASILDKVEKSLSARDSRIDLLASS